LFPFVAFDRDSGEVELDAAVVNSGFLSGIEGNLIKDYFRWV